MKRMLNITTLDTAVHELILGSLSGKDLARVASTCTTFNELATGSSSISLWKSLCENLLGATVAQLHASAASPQDVANASFWRHLFKEASLLNVVRWCNETTRILRRNTVCEGSLSRDYGVASMGASAHAALVARLSSAADLIVQSEIRESEEDGAVQSHVDEHRRALQVFQNLLAERLLARTGHTATVLDTSKHIVLIGGLVSQDNAPKSLEVLIVDVKSLSIFSPKVDGHPPETRFRHAASYVSPPLSSALTACKESRDGWSLVVAFGGYNRIGQEFGESELVLLWVSPNGEKVKWDVRHLSGLAPPCRFHHTLHAINDHRGLLLVGGEGGNTAADYPQEEEPMAETQGVSAKLWLLDLVSLTWSQVQTRGAVGNETRTLHASCIHTRP
ncbi:hypothetical protein CYMTET_28539, partial [Cymbomonas tetramitiformis]